MFCHESKSMPGLLGTVSTYAAGLDSGTYRLLEKE
jgi:hypothetical protein